MPLFTSPREKRLWLWALVVFSAIYATLFAGRPLARLYGNQDVQALIFVSGMLLVGIVILLHGIKNRPGRIEMTVIIGIVAVYVMLFLRLGLPERSHLFEYSVLAIFIHRALRERKDHGRPEPKPALLAILITFFIGLTDECIQLFMPSRVFDPYDILFNGFVVTVAIGFSIVLTWVRRRGQKGG